MPRYIHKKIDRRVDKNPDIVILKWEKDREVDKNVDIEIHSRLVGLGTLHGGHTQERGRSRSRNP